MCKNTHIDIRIQRKNLRVRLRITGLGKAENHRMGEWISTGRIPWNAEIADV